MGALKVGLVSSPGFVHAGEVRVAEIGIPRALIQAQAVRAGVVERADLAVPRWAATDHKGRRGHVLVIAGSPGHRGAGRLAALAAVRAGAGLVTLAGPGDVTAADPIMTADTRDFAALVPGKDAIVIGPGMAKDPDLVTAALASGLPCVLDADALNQSRPELLARAAGPVVITPHPGEAARLLGTDIATIESDRLASVRRLAAATRAVAILKGARTVICDGTLGDEFVAINPTGGPALATGGTGDVLAGAIGALIAQGLAPAEAARTGVWAHGAAGDAAPRGAHAGDICDLFAAQLTRLE
jgi:NAD(P)H-hydrate epimerase